MVLFAPRSPAFKVLEPLFKVTLSISTAIPESPTPSKLLTRPYPAIFVPKMFRFLILVFRTYPNSGRPPSGIVTVWLFPSRIPLKAFRFSPPCRSTLPFLVAPIGFHPSGSEISSASWKYVSSKEKPSLFTLSRRSSISEAVLIRYGELSVPFPSHGSGASVTITDTTSVTISSL